MRGSHEVQLESVAGECSQRINRPHVPRPHNVLAFGTRVQGCDRNKRSGVHVVSHPLPAHRLVSLGCLHQNMRLWVTEPQPQRTGACSERRHGVWCAERHTGVRDGSLSSGLHAQRVVRVEHVQHELRHGQPEQEPLYYYGRKLRRQSLRRAERCADLLRRSLPCALRHVSLECMVTVHALVRQRRTESQPQRRDARCAWWLRVPAARGATRVRDRGLPRGLRAQRVVRVEHVQHELWYWCADQDSHHHCSNAVWWETLRSTHRA